MLLRWLIENYARTAAGSQMKSSLQAMLAGVLNPDGTASSAGRGGTSATGEANHSTGGDELAPPCDALIVFALGIESGGLIDRLERISTIQENGFTEHACRWEKRELVVLETGAGSTAAAKAVADAIAFHRPKWVISAGFAGALSPELKRNQFLMVDAVTKPAGETIAIGLRVSADPAQRPAGVHVGKLLTVEKIIKTKREKQQLGEQHTALACDMETFAIAEVCRQQQTRLLAIRIISDGLDDELPAEVEQLLKPKSWGETLGIAARALVKRPAAALDLFKLQDEAMRSSDKLAKFLVACLPQVLEG